jgi:hypothetical protein
MDRIDNRPGHDVDPADCLAAVACPEGMGAPAFRAANLPTRGGDVRQDRGGQHRTAGVSSSVAGVVLLALASPTFAACPIELATYADMEGVAELEFTPTLEAITVTNSFKLLLDNNVVLDGVVQWTQGVARPNGMLMHECPEGDVTGQELAICTVWQGVIYTSDKLGNIALLPVEGAEAPEKLILPDLGPSLRLSSAYGANGFSNVPWDVFALKGCQE